MDIQTSRFGTLTVSEENTMTFPEGILGFSNLEKYCIVESTDHSLFLWLQALEKHSVAFPLIEPQFFKKTYRVELEHEDRKALKIKNIESIETFVIVTIPTDPSKMTANLRAPIVFNKEKKLARQVILTHEDYPIRHPVYQELQSFCATSNRTIFASDESFHFQVRGLEASSVSASA